MSSLRKIGFVAAGLLFALSACSKSTTSSSTSASSAPQSSTAASPVGSPAAATSPAAAANTAGASVYNTNCASCHQATGEGVAGAFPPLAGNPTVTGSAAKVIHIVKYGLKGAITVKGKSYNGMMPPWGTTLSNADIAAVISYVRSSWGNAATPVTVADVKAVAK